MVVWPFGARTTRRKLETLVVVCSACTSSDVCNNKSCNDDAHAGDGGDQENSRKFMTSCGNDLFLNNRSNNYDAGDNDQERRMKNRQ